MSHHHTYYVTSSYILQRLSHMRVRSTEIVSCVRVYSTEIVSCMRVYSMERVSYMHVCCTEIVSCMRVYSMERVSCMRVRSMEIVSYTRYMYAQHACWVPPESQRYMYAQHTCSQAQSLIFCTWYTCVVQRMYSAFDAVRVSAIPPPPPPNTHNLFLFSDRLSMLANRDPFARILCLCRLLLLLYACVCVCACVCACVWSIFGIAY